MSRTLSRSFLFSITLLLAAGCSDDGVDGEASRSLDGKADGDEGAAHCGGFAGFTCPAGEFCDYDLDAMCGAADQMGVCRPMPDACASVYDPVCGCDGQTYSNACDANAVGVSVAKTSACDAPTEDWCGGFPGRTCGAGQYCHYELSATCGWADATGTCQAIPDFCPAVYAPVCGCDGQTYSNACNANQAGVSVRADGPCS